jgi:hypothetical protein
MDVKSLQRLEQRARLKRHRVLFENKTLLGLKFAHPLRD